MFATRAALRQCKVLRNSRFINTTGNETPAEYCLHLVRDHDYENFLCTLLLPKESKSIAFAIRAFNVEVALVEDRIKDKQIGLMRMKFWNKVIDNVYNNKPAKIPVALELHRVLQKQMLSKHYFKQLVDAREYKLTASKFLNMDSVEKYAENSVSPIYYLLLEANQIKDADIEHLANYTGKAQGIVTLIRSIKYNAQKQTVILPDDLLKKHKVTEQMIMRAEHSPELSNLIAEVAEKAQNHIDKAMNLKNHLKGNSKSIFLPLYITQRYLKRLKKVNFNIYDKNLVRRDSLLPIKIFYRKLMNQPF